MRTIQSRLLQIFALQIFALGVAGVFSFTLYTSAVNKYKSISDNMVLEYHLTETAFNLITEFNNLAVSSTPSSQVTEETKIRDIKSNIHQIYAALDNSITDSDTKITYIGLKNTISALESEIDAGVGSIEAGGGQDTTAHFNRANLLYGFVKENSSTFLTSELRHVTAIQRQVNQSKTKDFQIGGIAYLLALIASIIYAARISKVIVKPIDRLTSTATQITQGNMDIAISPELLDRKDETGRLSNAFNVMLAKLKEKINELHEEKASVEQKVIERTKELNDEKARLEASIDSLNIGFIMTDSSDNIIMLNRIATRLLSYTITPEGVSKIDTSISAWTAELVDQKMGDGFPFKENMAKAKSLVLPIEKKALSYGGRIFRIFIAPITVFDNIEKTTETLGTVTLIEDITEQKVQERSKDEFFSIASHELRTPLTAIRGNIALIQSYYKDQLAKDRNLKGMVDDIHESSVRLIEIVSDFLDASRLEQGKLKFVPDIFELDKIIEDVLYDLSSVSRAKGVELKFSRTRPESSTNVYADKNRTKQVIYNLVGNALKFTEKGTITLNIRPENSAIKVLVSDTGAGMSANSQQLLFHKFQQAGDSIITRDASHGTGLGLYISKLIVEGMGGSIQLESSAPDRGSVFSFTLPVAEPRKQSNS
jgi:signal transduction histidine kinase/HAMP domain-containing protein